MKRRASVQVGPGERPVFRLALSEDNLRQTKLTIAKSALRASQPEVPHTVEPLVEHLDDLRAVLLVRLAPQFQCSSVVPPQVLAVGRPQVVQRQPALDLGNRRQISPWEDILIHPGIHRPRLLLRDRMEQRDATLDQQLRNLTEILVTVTTPHVLEHADTDDPIERLIRRQILVVHEFESHQVRHTLTLCQLTCTSQLRRTECNTQDSCLVLLGSGDGQVAPTAADVQQAHAGTNPQLAQYVVDLLVLRLLQTVGPILEVRTGVRTGWIQEQPVVVVAHAVVGLDVPLLRLLPVGAAAERLTCSSLGLVSRHQLEEQRKLLFVDLESSARVGLANGKTSVHEHASNYARVLNSDQEHRFVDSSHPRIATN